MAEKKKEKIEAQTLSIDLTYPEALIGRYANHVIVQAGAHEVNILFYEIRPPMLMGSSEQVQEQAKHISSVKAECVSRVIVPVNIVPNLLAALTNVAGRMLAHPAIRNVSDDPGRTKTKGE